MSNFGLHAAHLEPITVDKEADYLSESRAFYVGVYWWRDASYAALKRCDSFEDAVDQARVLSRLGYDNKGVSEIRIIEQQRKYYAFGEHLSVTTPQE